MRPIHLSAAAAAAIATFALTSASGFADPTHHGDAVTGSRQATGAGPSESMHYGMMDPALSMIGQNGVDSALMNAVKTRLAITADQQPAWQAYIRALQGNVTAMRSMHEAMDKIHDPKTSSEDVHILMDDIHESQRQALADVQAAHSALLDVLTDDQKRTASTLVLHGELLGRSMGATRMMGGHGMMTPCESSAEGDVPPKT